MKHIFLALAAFATCTLHSAIFDLEADQDILDRIYSKEFSNTQITYQYEDKKYPIRMIANTQRKILWGNVFDKPVAYPLILIANLPFDVVHHIEDILPKEKDFREKSYIDLRGFTSPKDFIPLRPIYLATKIEDPLTDEQIKKAFTSQEFINLTAYYYLDEEFFKVRILHNPHKKTYTAKMDIPLEPDEAPRTFEITWSSKYGIITNKRVPYELIDHLSKFTNASNWDWYFSFDVHNGNYVEYKKYSVNYETTYDLETWFDFTAHLKEKI